MTPLRINFTGLDVDPMDLQNRLYQGVIPIEWHRHRFAIEQGSISQINRWLMQNIAGRWAILLKYVGGKREVVIAFERDYDGSTFVLSDGARQCCMI